MMNDRSHRFTLSSQRLSCYPVGSTHYRLPTTKSLDSSFRPPVWNLPANTETQFGGVAHCLPGHHQKVSSIPLYKRLLSHRVTHKLSDRVLTFKLPNFQTLALKYDFKSNKRATMASKWLVCFSILTGTCNCRNTIWNDKFDAWVFNTVCWPITQFDYCVLW